MTTPYAIFQDGGYYDDVKGLGSAIELAEELLGGVPEGQDATFSVESKEGLLMAAVSNRRITGRFIQQQWGGRKGDDAIFVGEEEFDATDDILLMEHERLAELDDNDESSDEIGRAHVDWAGPCEVRLVDSVCAYFGVNSLEDITPAALAYARNRANPQEAETTEVTLNIQLKLRVSPGASVDEFRQNLDYSVTSNTTGVTVSYAKLVESD